MTFTALAAAVGATPEEADVLLERMEGRIPPNAPSKIMAEVAAELEAIRKGAAPSDRYRPGHIADGRCPHPNSNCSGCCAICGEA
jgi:hypothetical protein